MSALDAPANYRDPEPGPMGWGDPTKNIAQNRLIEAAHQDALPNVMAMQDAVGASGILPEIEKRLRAKMHFDEGWDFMVAERELYGLSAQQTVMVPQSVGDCVGDSHACLLAGRISHEVYALGEAEEPLGPAGDKMMFVPFVAFSYGVGRLYGGMLGPGDGSYCGAQIGGSMKYGFLPSSTPGLEVYGNLPEGTGQSVRLFGRSQSEIEKWTDKASKFDLVEAPKVKTVEDAWDCVVNKKCPYQICSGWAFVYKGFDSKYGVHTYVHEGSWSHSMQIMAAFRIKGQEFYVIRNQWGLNAHKGSPEIGIAGGCMVITAETLAKWLPQAEAIAIGQMKGLTINPYAKAA